MTSITLISPNTFGVHTGEYDYLVGEMFQGGWKINQHKDGKLIDEILLDSLQSCLRYILEDEPEPYEAS